MLELFLKKKIRFKTKEDFLFEFFANPHHHWITEDKYIRANFEEFFSFVPLKTIQKIWGSSDVWFINSTGKYSCAVQTYGCSVVLIFPELKKLLRSMNSSGAKAILSHELGHIFHEHAKKNMDIIEAQVEADKFSIDLGFIDELEEFLQDQPESVEKRVRLAYLSSHYFSENDH